MEKKSCRQPPEAARLTPILYCGNAEIEAVQTRIHLKMKDFAQYQFTNRQSCALNIFFDLAQEFEEAGHLHLLSVLILRIFFQLEAELYSKDANGALILRTPKISSLPANSPPASLQPHWEYSCLYLPVRGKHRPEIIQLHPDSSEYLLGMLVVATDATSAFSSGSAEEVDLLFLEKYANRIGYTLHNKLLADRNRQHVLFLRNLAHDIGHNITTPNMRFKLMLLQLDEHISGLRRILDMQDNDAARKELSVLHDTLQQQSKELMGQFKNGALFLESLLRQSHFDQGHYALRCAHIDICSKVILPQLQRYRANLEERGIHIDASQPKLPQDACMVLADLGLISQALANFLGNAVKYTQPPSSGEPPSVRCEASLIPGAFPHGTAGVKVAVSTTGPPLAPEDEAHLFENSFRAANVGKEFGTGHGLFFVREIVNEHHGISGYERTPHGNSFYFILPLENE